LIIANNILLDSTDPNNPTVLIKLYEPLPQQFDLQSQLWVVTQVANSVAYNVDISFIFDIEDNNINLAGPNYNLNILDQINNSTAYTNYNTLKQTSGSYSQGTGSLKYQLNSLLVQPGININIDYSDYSNFIHFSNAQARLENFYYKLSLLEQYTYSASFSNNSSSGSYYISSSNVIWQSKINEIITTFDDYEYFLYYNSGSASWPKTNTSPPYINATTSSIAAQIWLNSQLIVAQDYDLQNNNALTLAIPSYITEDSNNDQFILFVEMIGQFFDNIFVYLQNVTTKFDADNRLTYGVSKDLVADILRDLGVNLYQNNFSSNDLYQALLGLTPSGSLYNLPYTTTQYPVPSNSGLEYIATYVTASSTSSLYPTDDINKEQYKRIYHNLPLLLKKKGSVAGLRDLITTFGIPDTILRINEFGGKDRDVNSFDNWQDEYNYAFYTSGSSYISSSFNINSSWGANANRPQAVEFRFKTDGLPQNTASVASQSLFETDLNVKLILRYTGSGYTTSSFISSSADPINPYYQYGVLDLIPDPAFPNTSASIYLPFFDGEWWSVLVNKYVGDYTLYAKNKNYKGEDGNIIGFQASSSVTTSPSPWSNSTKVYFGISSSLSGKIFTGSLQEIRYYSVLLPETNFDAYVMNPYSIENSDYLAFRATLGGELYTSSKSVHPRVTGSWSNINSFVSTSNFYLSGSYSWNPNTEVFYFDQVPAGIQNAISDKIKQQNIVLPYSSSIDSNIPNSNVLSPFISIQQFPSISSSYTRDIDYVEVAFSPQNEINEDINSQIGYFNIGDIIGDPRFQSSSAEIYPELNSLSNYYFEKYTSNYQEWDYIRLIEFFDNSLFKMLQDWTPARTSLAAGIVIKNTLLDRNRYRPPQVSPSSSILTIGSGSSAIGIPYIVEDLTITGSIESGFITGSSGGSFPELFGQTSSFFTYPNVVNVTQSWDGFTPSKLGPVSFTQNSQTEFFDGQLSGSNLVVTTQSLNDCNVSIVQVGTYLSGTLITINANTVQPIKYDFDIDFTYYLSFQYQLANGTTITLKDNAGIVYFTDSNSTGVLVTRNVTLLEVNNPLYPLGWIKTGAGSVGAGYTTIYQAYVAPDCYVIANDAQINRPSNRYMEVDFSSDYVIAINEQSILSGSATKASIPDSNYSIDTGYANARYYGCKTTSPTGSIGDFYVNQPVSGSSTLQNSNNVQTYVDWFAYYTDITRYNAGSDYPFTTDQVYITTLINGESQTITLDAANQNTNQAGNTGFGLSINSSPSESTYSNRGLVGDIFFRSSSVNLYTFTTGSTNPLSGSTLPVLLGGGFYTSSLGTNNFIINEQSVLLYTPNNITSQQRSNSGLLVPSNLNPTTKNNLLRIAQAAGFFKNI
jgi:hypothetical protein